LGGGRVDEPSRRALPARYRPCHPGRGHGSLGGVGTIGAMQETSKIWMNGELVDWADATVHVGTHGLHYSSGVFEGIRAYETPRGTAVFRLTEHFERLANSAKLLYMELPYSVAEL